MARSPSTTSSTMLVRGEVVRHDVTFPEGKSLEEMADDRPGARGLDAEAFLQAARDPAAIRDLDPDALDLEGYLFPDTYDVPRTPEAPASIVARMVGRFRAVVAPELPRPGRVRPHAASGGHPRLPRRAGDGAGRGAARIAAVFLNRLKQGMLLQTDPTVIYALRKAGAYDGNIRKKDLALDSPYNTYKCPGLPPGPIASPGREAIEAVAGPADVKDLYFVSRNDGTHEFSETLAEHERAVDRYQRRRGATRGEAKG